MKMNKNRMSNFYVPVLLLLLTAFAACDTATDDRRYADWDEDSNAGLDEGEFRTAWDDVGYYDRWDTNNDAYIDENEWNTGRDRYLVGYDRVYADLDTDADNRISEDELRAEVYTYYDRDRDALITEEEYTVWYEQPQE